MKIFISYAHEDTFIVKQYIVNVLQAAGHIPWFDHNLVVGQSWKAQLAQQILECDAFLWAVSPVSVISEWCKWEFAKAVDEGKPVIPILLRKTELPSELREIQYVDFRDGADIISVARLLGGLQNIQGSQLPSISDEPIGVPTGIDETLSDNISNTKRKITIVNDDIIDLVANRLENLYEEIHQEFLAYQSRLPAQLDVNTSIIDTNIDLFSPKKSTKEIVSILNKRFERDYKYFLKQNIQPKILIHLRSIFLYLNTTAESYNATFDTDESKHVVASIYSTNPTNFDIDVFIKQIESVIVVNSFSIMILSINLPTLTSQIGFLLVTQFPILLFQTARIKQIVGQKFNENVIETSNSLIVEIEKMISETLHQKIVKPLVVYINE